MIEFLVVTVVFVIALAAHFRADRLEARVAAIETWLSK
jgi:hypothetical protein